MSSLTCEQHKAEHEEVVLEWDPPPPEPRKSVAGAQETQPQKPFADCISFQEQTPPLQELRFLITDLARSKRNLFRKEDSAPLSQAWKSVPHNSA